MSRYIDEISARENFQDVLAYMGSEVKRILKKVPTADVVAVVRCRDCKYKITANFNGEILIGCSNPSGLVDICADGFCSYGERREE